MKKVVFSLIILIFFAFIIFVPTDGGAQGRLKLGIVLPLTGSFAPWGREVRESINEITSRISTNLEVIYYDDKGGSEPIALNIVGSAMSTKTQVIIAPFWEERIVKSVLPTIWSKEIITIFPKFSIQLMELIKEFKANAYFIPEPTDRIILAIDQSVRKTGPSNLDSLRETLIKEATMAQEKAVAYQNQISKEVIKAVEQWEIKEKIPVLPAAKEFLAKDYSSKFVSFVTKFSAREEEFPRLIKAIPRDTNDILDQYVKLKYKKGKGKSIFKVDLVPFSESGVNGCKELPCKQHCCDNYKIYNVDDCLGTMRCKRETSK